MMPYEIRQDDDDQYCVWKLEPDELLKCYGEQAEAGAYLAALQDATEDEEPVDEKAVQIKAITDDDFTIAGYGVVYGGRDLEGDSFAADTDYMLDSVPEPVVLYDHAQEIKSVLGRVTKISAKEAGLWMEAQISRAKDYAEQVLELVKNGKLGYSTGSVAHLVER